MFSTILQLSTLADLDLFRDLDAFDLICHVVYDRPPLTRRERAESVKKRDVFARYGEQARAVLNALLRIPANVSSDSGRCEHRLRGRRSEATIVAL